MKPVIDCRSVSQIRAAFARQRHSHVNTLLDGADITMAAAVEVAGWLHSHGRSEPQGMQILVNLQKRHPVVSAASELLQMQCSQSRQVILQKGQAELRCVTNLDTGDKEWWEFLSRFSTAAEETGIERTYSKALASAFHEMADNVVQHAAKKGGAVPANITGWHTANGIAAFVVLDAGRGIRASLAENSSWAHLTDDGEALRSVVCQQATRKAVNIHGDGYRTVVKNFVDRNGCLSVRSGAGELAATGTLSEGIIRSSPYPVFTGTRVAAWCAPHASSFQNEQVVK